MWRTSCYEEGLEQVCEGARLWLGTRRRASRSPPRCPTPDADADAVSVGYAEPMNVRVPKADALPDAEGEADAVADADCNS